jgi:hypothetical protein
LFIRIVVAADLQGVVPIVQREHGIVCEFFETDSSMRTTNAFTARRVGSSATVIGETNWVSYRVTFPDASHFDWSCFSPIQRFKLD